MVRRLRTIARRKFLASAVSVLGGSVVGRTVDGPDTYVDEETGHRVLVIAGGSASGLYFHQNPFTAFADKMVYRAPTPAGPQSFVYDFRTSRRYQLTREPGGMGHEIVGPTSRRLYYRAGTSIKSIALDTLEVRHICDLPSDLSLYHYTLSSDERTLASGYYDGGRDIAALPRAQVFVKMFEAHLRNVIYTIDIETGHYEEVHEEGNWLGHFQFSPTDPNTLMFCHEGPWARLDRIWLLDLTERDARLVYRREREGEIAGHEFWHPDGTCVWFDLRYPPQAEFYLASTDIVTGETARYPLRPEEWSVHYNVDRQGRRICGDGGGLGPWIYLYEPRADATVSVSKLCSLAGHDYARWEPNVHFSPDGKWVTFAANMHGENRVYAVGASAEED